MSFRLTLPIAIAGFVAVALAESRRPLRRRVEARGPHAVRDIAVGALSVVTTALLQHAVAPFTERVRRLGPLQRMRIPRSIRVMAGVLLLDYSLWFWHWLNHRAPLLWRFHRVHHVDRDLDSATGLRFHFGEMTLSVLFRLIQLRLIGPDPAAVSIWQTLLLLSVFFHHSNLRLDSRIEGRLVSLIVTPRMHGIHHSDFAEEANSNWASLFTIWDRLHGTLLLDVPQRDITIGVPAYGQAGDVTLNKILALPVRSTALDWHTPDGEQHLTRT